MRNISTLVATCLLGLLCAQGVQAQDVDQVLVRVANPLDQQRPHATVEIAWERLTGHLPVSEDEVRVLNASGESEVASQVVDTDGDEVPDALLFQANFWPEETKTFVVEPRPPQRSYEPRVHAMHESDRDDVAWESDRVAFRTYGQGLWEQEDLVSSGIDVWMKRTRDLVTERWYADGHYHQDHGEGADFFSVGPTLGAGGTALWVNDSLHRAPNFTSYRILEDGPIRLIAELTYEPWTAGDMQVSEVKRITMDAGQHVFKQESTFDAEEAERIPYATGLVKRSGVVGSMNTDSPWAWLSAWGPVGNDGHGDLGTAVLLPAERLDAIREAQGHYLALATAEDEQPVTHFVGAGWTASRDFDGVSGWWKHLDALAARLAAPLKVTITTEAP